MQPTRSHIPQLGPVLVLQALLTEHRELPLLVWHLDTDGLLSAGLNEGVDPLTGREIRQLMEAYARALGGHLSEPFRFTNRGESRVSQRLIVVWRGVEVRIVSYAGLSAYPELLAVAA
ncbi:hypothetical protein [Kitasatospora sp. NPDC004289]